MKKLRETDENVTILPGARVCGDVEFGPGCSVWYNAVIRADLPIRVGRDTNFQDNVVVHTGNGPMTIGDCVTVGHGAILHGSAVGSGTVIGMGAILLQGCEIGSECMVAAGSVVTGKTKAPDGSMLMGSPARVVRALSEQERAACRAGAEHYVQLKKEHEE